MLGKPALWDWCWLATVKQYRYRRKYLFLPDLLGNLTRLKRVADDICPETSHSSLSFNLPSPCSVQHQASTLGFPLWYLQSVNSHKGLGFNKSGVKPFINASCKISLLFVGVLKGKIQALMQMAQWCCDHVTKVEPKLLGRMRGKGTQFVMVTKNFNARAP